MLIKIHLDDNTSSKLIDLAALEKRSAYSQAEVLIMHALGTWEPDQVTTGPLAKSKFPKQKNRGGTMIHE